MIPELTQVEQERFWAKVDKTSECWVWTGSRSASGHGHVRIRGRTLLTHRVSLSLTGIVVQDDGLVCHHCDNPPCVRPEHLYAGNAASNVRDMYGRNRFPVARGEKHTLARLTNEKAREIRIALARGVPQRQLALRYGVSTQLIYRIAHNRSWRVPEAMP